MLGPEVGESAHEPFMRCSSICHSPGCELCWSSKPDALGAHLSATDLKSWGAGCGVPPLFVPQREAPDFVFPHNCGS